MNDAEWKSWQQKWSQADGRLPDVRAMAQRQALRHRLGTWALIALYAFGVVANVWVVLFDHGDLVISVFLSGWALAVSATLLWVQRAAQLRPGDGPKEALGFFERRIGVERAAAQIFRWAHVASIVFISVYYRDLFGDDFTVKLIARLSMGVMLAATFSAPWWVKKVTQRQQLEVDGFRRWLEEQQL